VDIINIKITKPNIQIPKSKYDPCKQNGRTNVNNGHFCATPPAGDSSNSKYHSPLDSIRDRPEDEEGADDENGEQQIGCKYPPPPEDQDDVKTSKSSTSPTTSSVNKSNPSPTTSTHKSHKSASVVSLTSDSDSLFAKRFPPPPPPKKLPTSKRRKAKKSSKKGLEGHEAFVFVEEEVKKANQRNGSIRRNKRKGRRSRSSVEDESLALQSLEDINLDQGDQVEVREELC